MDICISVPTASLKVETYRPARVRVTVQKPTVVQPQFRETYFVVFHKLTGYLLPHLVKLHDVVCAEAKKRAHARPFFIG